jgi:hypothetical protein
MSFHLLTDMYGHGERIGDIAVGMCSRRSNTRAVKDCQGETSGSMNEPRASDGELPCPYAGMSMTASGNKSLAIDQHSSEYTVTHQRRRVLSSLPD